MLRPLARQAREGREIAAERRVVLKAPVTVEGVKAPADAAIATTIRTFLSIL
jgi:plasmid stability protein